MCDNKAIATNNHNTLTHATTSGMSEVEFVHYPSNFGLRNYKGSWNLVFKNKILDGIIIVDHENFRKIIKEILSTINLDNRNQILDALINRKYVSNCIINVLGKNIKVEKNHVSINHDDKNQITLNQAIRDNEFKFGILPIMIVSSLLIGGAIVKVSIDRRNTHCPIRCKFEEEFESIMKKIRIADKICKESLLFTKGVETGTYDMMKSINTLLFYSNMDKKFIRKNRRAVSAGHEKIYVYEILEGLSRLAYLDHMSAELKLWHCYNMRCMKLGIKPKLNVTIEVDDTIAYLVNLGNITSEWKYDIVQELNEWKTIQSLVNMWQYFESDWAVLRAQLISKLDYKAGKEARVVKNIYTKLELARKARKCETEQELIDTYMQAAIIINSGLLAYTTEYNEPLPLRWNVAIQELKLAKYMEGKPLVDASRHEVVNIADMIPYLKYVYLFADKTKKDALWYCYCLYIYERTTFQPNKLVRFVGDPNFNFNLLNSKIKVLKGKVRDYEINDMGYVNGDRYKQTTLTRNIPKTAGNEKGTLTEKDALEKISKQADYIKEKETKKNKNKANKTKKCKKIVEVDETIRQEEDTDNDGEVRTWSDAEINEYKKNPGYDKIKITWYVDGVKSEASAIKGIFKKAKLASKGTNKQQKKNNKRPEKPAVIEKYVPPTKVRSNTKPQLGITTVPLNNNEGIINMGLTINNDYEVVDARGVVYDKIERYNKKAMFGGEIKGEYCWLICSDFMKCLEISVDGEWCKLKWDSANRQYVIANAEKCTEIDNARRNWKTSDAQPNRKKKKSMKRPTQARPDYAWVHNDLKSELEDMTNGEFNFNTRFRVNEVEYNKWCTSMKLMIEKTTKQPGMYKSYCREDRFTEGLKPALAKKVPFTVSRMTSVEEILHKIGHLPNDCPMVAWSEIDNTDKTATFHFDPTKGFRSVGEFKAIFDTAEFVVYNRLINKRLSEPLAVGIDLFNNLSNVKHLQGNKIIQYTTRYTIVSLINAERKSIDSGFFETENDYQVQFGVNNLKASLFDEYTLDSKSKFVKKVDEHDEVVVNNYFARNRFEVITNPETSTNYSNEIANNDNSNVYVEEVSYQGLGDYWADIDILVHSVFKILGSNVEFSDQLIERYKSEEWFKLGNKFVMTLNANDLDSNNLYVVIQPIIRNGLMGQENMFNLVTNNGHYLLDNKGLLYSAPLNSSCVTKHGASLSNLKIGETHVAKNGIYTLYEKVESNSFVALFLSANAYSYTKLVNYSKVKTFNIPIITNAAVNGILPVHIKNKAYIINAELLNDLIAKNMTGNLGYKAMLNYGLSLLWMKYTKRGDSMKLNNFSEEEIKVHCYVAQVLIGRNLIFRDLELLSLTTHKQVTALVDALVSFIKIKVDLPRIDSFNNFLKATSTYWNDIESWANLDLTYGELLTTNACTHHANCDGNTTGITCSCCKSLTAVNEHFCEHCDTALLSCGHTKLNVDPGTVICACCKELNSKKICDNCCLQVDYNKPDEQLYQPKTKERHYTTQTRSFGANNRHTDQQIAPGTTAEQSTTNTTTTQLGQPTLTTTTEMTQQKLSQSTSDINDALLNDLSNMLDKNTYENLLGNYESTTPIDETMSYVTGIPADESVCGANTLTVLDVIENNYKMYCGINVILKAVGLDMLDSVKDKYSTNGESTPRQLIKLCQVLNVNVIVIAGTTARCLRVSVSNFFICVLHAGNNNSAEDHWTLCKIVRNDAENNKFMACSLATANQHDAVARRLFNTSYDFTNLVERMAITDNLIKNHALRFETNLELPKVVGEYFTNNSTLRHDINLGLISIKITGFENEFLAYTQSMNSGVIDDVLLQPIDIIEQTKTDVENYRRNMIREALVTMIKIAKKDVVTTQEHFSTVKVGKMSGIDVSNTKIKTMDVIFIEKNTTPTMCRRIDGIVHFNSTNTSNIKNINVEVPRMSYGSAVRKLVGMFTRRPGNLEALIANPGFKAVVRPGGGGKTTNIAKYVAAFEPSEVTVVACTSGGVRSALDKLNKMIQVISYEKALNSNRKYKHLVIDECTLLRYGDVAMLCEDTQTLYLTGDYTQIGIVDMMTIGGVRNELDVLSSLPRDKVEKSMRTFRYNNEIAQALQEFDELTDLEWESELNIKGEEKLSKLTMISWDTVDKQEFVKIARAHDVLLVFYQAHLKKYKKIIELNNLSTKIMLCDTVHGFQGQERNKVMVVQEPFGRGDVHVRPGYVISAATRARLQLTWISINCFADDTRLCNRVARGIVGSNLDQNVTYVSMDIIEKKTFLENISTTIGAMLDSSLGAFTKRINNEDVKVTGINLTQEFNEFEETIRANNISDTFNKNYDYRTVKAVLMLRYGTIVNNAELTIVPGGLKVTFTYFGKHFNMTVNENNECTTNIPKIYANQLEYVLKIATNMDADMIEIGDYKYVARLPDTYTAVKIITHFAAIHECMGELQLTGALEGVKAIRRGGCGSCSGLLLTDGDNELEFGADYFKWGARTINYNRQSYITDIFGVTGSLLLTSDECHGIDITNRELSIALLAERINSFVYSLTRFKKIMHVYAKENEQKNNVLEENKSHRRFLDYEKTKNWPICYNNYNIGVHTSTTIITEGKVEWFILTSSATKRWIQLCKLAFANDVIDGINSGCLYNFVSKMYAKLAGSIGGLWRTMEWHKSHNTNTYERWANKILAGELKVLSKTKKTICMSSEGAQRFKEYTKIIRVNEIGNLRTLNPECEAESMYLYCAMKKLSTSKAIVSEIATTAYNNDSDGVVISPDIATVNWELTSEQLMTSCKQQLTRGEFPNIAAHVESNSVLAKINKKDIMHTSWHDHNILTRSLYVMAQIVENTGQLWFTMPSIETKENIYTFSTGNTAVTVHPRLQDAIKDGKLIIVQNTEYSLKIVNKVADIMLCKMSKEENLWADPFEADTMIKVISMPMLLANPSDWFKSENESSSIIGHTNVKLIPKLFENLTRRMIKQDTTIEDLLIQARTLYHSEVFTTNRRSKQYAVTASAMILHAKYAYLYVKLTDANLGIMRLMHDDDTEVNNPIKVQLMSLLKTLLAEVSDTIIESINEKVELLTKDFFNTMENAELHEEDNKQITIILTNYFKAFVKSLDKLNVDMGRGIRRFVGAKKETKTLLKWIHWGLNYLSITYDSMETTLNGNLYQKWEKLLPEGAIQINEFDALVNVAGLRVNARLFAKLLDSEDYFGEYANLPVLVNRRKRATTNVFKFKTYMTVVNDILIHTWLTHDGTESITINANEMITYKKSAATNCFCGAATVGIINTCLQHVSYGLTVSTEVLASGCENNYDMCDCLYTCETPSVCNECGYSMFGMGAKYTLDSESEGTYNVIMHHAYSFVYAEEKDIKSMHDGNAKIHGTVDDCAMCKELIEGTSNDDEQIKNEVGDETKDEFESENSYENEILKTIAKSFSSFEDESGKTVREWMTECYGSKIPTMTTKPNMNNKLRITNFERMSKVDRRTIGGTRQITQLAMNQTSIHNVVNAFGYAYNLNTRKNLIPIYERLDKIDVKVIVYECCERNNAGAIKLGSLGDFDVVLCDHHDEGTQLGYIYKEHKISPEIDTVLRIDHLIGMPSTNSWPMHYHGWINAVAPEFHYTKVLMKSNTIVTEEMHDYLIENARVHCRRPELIDDQIEAKITNLNDWSACKICTSKKSVLNGKCHVCEFMNLLPRDRKITQNRLSILIDIAKNKYGNKWQSEIESTVSTIATELFNDDTAKQLLDFYDKTVKNHKSTKTEVECFMDAVNSVGTYPGFYDDMVKWTILKNLDESYNKEINKQKDNELHAHKLNEPKNKNKIIDVRKQGQRNDSIEHEMSNKLSIDVFNLSERTFALFNKIDEVGLELHMTAYLNDILKEMTESNIHIIMPYGMGKGLINWVVTSLMKSKRKWLCDHSLLDENADVNNAVTLSSRTNNTRPNYLILPSFNSLEKMEETEFKKVINNIIELKNKPQIKCYALPSIIDIVELCCNFVSMELPVAWKLITKAGDTVLLNREQMILERNYVINEQEIFETKITHSSELVKSHEFEIYDREIILNSNVTIVDMYYETWTPTIGVIEEAILKWILKNEKNHTTFNLFKNKDNLFELNAAVCHYELFQKLEGLIISKSVISEQFVISNRGFVHILNDGFDEQKAINDIANVYLNNDSLYYEEKGALVIANGKLVGYMKIEDIDMRGSIEDIYVNVENKLIGKFDKTIATDIIIHDYDGLIHDKLIEFMEDLDTTIGYLQASYTKFTLGIKRSEDSKLTNKQQKILEMMLEYKNKEAHHESDRSFKNKNMYTVYNEHCINELYMQPAKLSDKWIELYIDICEQINKLEFENNDTILVTALDNGIDRSPYPLADRNIAICHEERSGFETLHVNKKLKRHRAGLRMLIWLLSDVNARFMMAGGRSDLHGRFAEDYLIQSKYTDASLTTILDGFCMDTVILTKRPAIEKIAIITNLLLVYGDIYGMDEAVAMYLDPITIIQNKGKPHYCWFDVAKNFKRFRDGCSYVELNSTISGPVYNINIKDASFCCMRKGAGRIALSILDKRASLQAPLLGGLINTIYQPMLSLKTIKEKMHDYEIFEKLELMCEKGKHTLRCETKYDENLDVKGDCTLLTTASCLALQSSVILDIGKLRSMYAWADFMDTDHVTSILIVEGFNVMMHENGISNYWYINDNRPWIMMVILDFGKTKHACRANMIYYAGILNDSIKSNKKIVIHGKEWKHKERLNVHRRLINLEYTIGRSMNPIRKGGLVITNDSINLNEIKIRDGFYAIITNIGMVACKCNNNKLYPDKKLEILWYTDYIVDLGIKKKIQLEERTILRSDVVLQALNNATFLAFKRMEPSYKISMEKSYALAIHEFDGIQHHNNREYETVMNTETINMHMVSQRRMDIKLLDLLHNEYGPLVVAMVDGRLRINTACNSYLAKATMGKCFNVMINITIENVDAVRTMLKLARSFDWPRVGNRFDVPNHDNLFKKGKIRQSELINRLDPKIDGQLIHDIKKLTEEVYVDELPDDNMHYKDAILAGKTFVKVYDSVYSMRYGLVISSIYKGGATANDIEGENIFDIKELETGKMLGFNDNIVQKKTENDKLSKDQLNKLANANMPGTVLESIDYVINSDEIGNDVKYKYISPIITSNTMPGSALQSHIPASTYNFWDDEVGMLDISIPIPKMDIKLRIRGTTHKIEKLIKETKVEYPTAAAPSMTKRMRAVESAASDLYGGTLQLAKVEINAEEELKRLARSCYIKGHEQRIKDYTSSKNQLTYDNEALINWLKQRPGASKIANECIEMLESAREVNPINKLNIHAKLESRVKDLMVSDERGGLLDRDNMDTYRLRLIVWQAKGITALFSPIFLKAKDRFKSLLMEKIIYTDGMTAQQVSALMRNVKNEESWFLEDDLKKQDRQTDKRIINVEMEWYMNHIGVAKHVIDLWRLAHEKWVAKNPLVKMQMDGMRQTGQATTALGNAFVNILIKSNLIEKNRALLQIMVLLGDDNLMINKKYIGSDQSMRLSKTKYNMLSETETSQIYGSYLRMIVYKNRLGTFDCGPDWIRLRRRFEVPNGVSENNLENSIARITSYCNMIGKTKEVEKLMIKYNIEFIPEIWYDITLLNQAIADKYACTINHVEDEYHLLIETMMKNETFIKERLMFTQATL